MPVNKLHQLRLFAFRHHLPNQPPPLQTTAYLYWEKVWKRENPRQKRHMPKRQPLYLEAEQQVRINT